MRAHGLKSRLFVGAISIFFVFLQVNSSQAQSSVTVQWNQSTEPNIKGYQLWYGTISHGYTQKIELGPTQSMTTVPGLQSGTVQYFALLAFRETCWGGPSVPGCATFPSQFSPEVVYTVPPATTPTVTPTPSATPAPTANPSPTPNLTPTPVPRITAVPSSINFAGITGGPFPSPQSIQVTTSNGSQWKSADSSLWFDAHPTGGSSGALTTIVPHTEGLKPGVYTDDITFSSAGLPGALVKVTLVIVPATPTPGPSATVSPSPTPTPSPTVTPAPSYSISVSPSSGIILQHGWTVSYNVLVGRLAGFTAPVTFDVTGLPAGVSSMFSPQPVPLKKTILKLTIDDCLPRGSYPFMITSQAGSPSVTRSIPAVLIKQ